MVLLALTMLLVALMVTMTIGLGLRIKQKHELQNLADAAAFSNGVAAARTFNNAALLNRLEVAYWAALAADQSLIAWASANEAVTWGAIQASMRMRTGSCGITSPTPAGQLAQRAARNAALVAFEAQAQIYARGSDSTMSGDWDNMDRAAGNESQRFQGQVVGLRSELSVRPWHAMPTGDDNAPIKNRLERLLLTQRLTNDIIANAGMSASVSVIGSTATSPASATGAQRLTHVEMFAQDEAAAAWSSWTADSVGATGTGLTMEGGWSDNMLQAALGSRDTWVAGHSGSPTKAHNRLNEFGNPLGIEVITAGGSGSGYWNATSAMHSGAFGRREAWGEQHGSISIRMGGCTESAPMHSYVRSTAIEFDNDQHRWGSGSDNTDPAEVHTMLSCNPECPSVWVRTLGFNGNEAPNNAWGQPKLIVALQRDLAAEAAVRKFPWELNFNFAGTQWDGRGRRLHGAAGSSATLSRQTAYASSMVYYHRQRHWREYPNLLNPFWRATLVAIDVDSNAGPGQGNSNDVRQSLIGSQFALQRDAVLKLRDEGFRGLH